MAGETLARIKSIGHDLAHSWYFRVWALIWLIMALVVFSGLIILSQNSEVAHSQESIQMWMSNDSTVTYPRFHLRLDPMGNEKFIVTPSCFYGLGSMAPLSTYTCAQWHGQNLPMSVCVAFGSETIKVTNMGGNYNMSMITCQVQTTGVGVNNNTMISLGLEGNNTLSWGGMAFHNTYIAPNNMVWVYLEKNTFQMNKHATVYDMWQKNLVYHSTEWQQGFYNISVIIGSFFVRHFEPMDIYNGWMTVGDIGGIAFFGVILHTIVMIIVGLFLSNSSSFLNGEEH